MKIYLDKNQCKFFGINYYKSESKIIISSSAILNSKEYDEYHQKILSPARDFVLIGTDSPGWFEVISEN